ncbi:hypothetical protein T08_11534 [Trichinella sp. T8]|nr:hypothetical protein T08_11534 [Trichinella sp. T8]
MSAIIKAIPHIADETANTKKQTDVNCELIENQQPSTMAANALSCRYSNVVLEIKYLTGSANQTCEERN